MKLFITAVCSITCAAGTAGALGLQCQANVQTFKGTSKPVSQKTIQFSSKPMGQFEVAQEAIGNLSVIATLRPDDTIQLEITRFGNDLPASGASLANASQGQKLSYSSQAQDGTLQPITVSCITVP